MEIKIEVGEEKFRDVLEKELRDKVFSDDMRGNIEQDEEEKEDDQ